MVADIDSRLKGSMNTQSKQFDEQMNHMRETMNKMPLEFADKFAC